MINKTTRYIGILAAAALLALAGATAAQAKNGADDPVGQHQSQGADDPAGQHQGQGADDPVGHDQGQGTDDSATQKTDDSKPSKQKRHGREAPQAPSPPRRRPPPPRQRRRPQPHLVERPRSARPPTVHHAQECQEEHPMSKDSQQFRRFKTTAVTAIAVAIALAAVPALASASKVSIAGGSLKYVGQGQEENNVGVSLLAGTYTVTDPGSGVS